jgi:2-succinyl-5-enolpyruvyl-6-hydroxy-3-cyclohexene-1-carboxylate synthase
MIGGPPPSNLRGYGRGQTLRQTSYFGRQAFSASSTITPSCNSLQTRVMVITKEGATEKNTILYGT